MTDLTIREAIESDVEALFDIRARTRENAIPRGYLESIGITAEAWSVKPALGPGANLGLPGRGEPGRLL